MSSLRRKLLTASGLTRVDQRLIVEASAALLVARLRSLLPFGVLARQLGGILAPHSQAGAPAPPIPAPSAPQAEADMIFAVR